MSSKRERLALLRRAAGMTQEHLAHTLDVERSTIHRWESGAATPRPDQQPPLARLLGVSPTDLADLLAKQPQRKRSSPPRDAADEASPPATAEAATAAGPQGNLDASSAVYTPGIDLLRRMVDVHDLPSDGPVRSLAELETAVAAVVSARLNSNYRRVLEQLPVLLPELTRALALWRGADREKAAAMLVRAYRAADAVADKLGYYDLSARIIHVMGWAAGQSGDELPLAATTYVRTETFFANGQLETGRLMLERAAERLPPKRSIESAATYGALHMRAAVVAARAGQPERAKEHLAEARARATQVTEGVYQGTAFGSASVRIHEVALELDLGAPDRALSVAADWAPPDRLPAERRSHFHVDVARARVLTKHTESVLAALDDARIAAPEHIRVHPHVREILEALPRTNGGQAHIQAFAARAGIEDAAYSPA